MAKKTDTTETKTKPNAFALTDNEQKDFNFVQARILKLQEVRTNHYGKNLDQIWADADRDYVPHRLQTTGKKVIATDEDKGWRGSVVNLGSNDWQSDLSQANVYIKIQTALSILVDQNPSGVFSAANKKFEAATELMKQLYERSWEFAKSKAQLKLFIFNVAKYGWGTARTYPLRISRKVKSVIEWNEENPDQSKYEEKTVEVYNDIMRENLDPRNVWIDDMAKPNNPFSIKDWCWRKVYDLDTFKEEFAGYKNINQVMPGGVLDEVVGTQSVNVNKNTVDKGNQVEVYFYENLQKDMFVVVAQGRQGVPVVMEPLPISDNQGNKKLSLWQAYWTLRHAESPYGIGMYEAMRYDQAMLDRFRNMTIDQITLSIYKMFFYQGTGQLTETGDITISPGVGKQVLDPKNITFLQVPGPGQDSYQGIEMLQKDVNNASGITEPITGEITGKTAFELAQAKESALKRMKDPLDNILEALNTEGYITVSLIQLLYSIPETYEVSDPLLIEDYLKEIQGDPELYERDEAGKFIAKVFPEFPLNLEKDESDNLIQTNDTRFFRIKPKMLKWEGIINIKSESILSPSEQIDRALESEMYAKLTPWLADPRPNAAELFGKMAKELVKGYNKDPRDVLPDSWLNAGQQDQSLFVQNPALAAAQHGASQPGHPPQAGQQPPTAPPQMPAQAISQQPDSIVGSVMSQINPLKTGQLG